MTKEIFLVGDAQLQRGDCRGWAAGRRTGGELVGDSLNLVFVCRSQRGKEEQLGLLLSAEVLLCHAFDQSCMLCLVHAICGKQGECVSGQGSVNACHAVATDQQR